MQIVVDCIPSVEPAKAAGENGLYYRTHPAAAYAANYVFGPRLCVKL